MSEDLLQDLPPEPQENLSAHLSHLHIGSFPEAVASAPELVSESPGDSPLLPSQYSDLPPPPPYSARPQSEGYQYGATGAAVGGYQPQPGTYQPALYQKGSPRYSLEGTGGYHQGPGSFPQQGYQLPDASAPPPHPGHVLGPASPIVMPTQYSDLPPPPPYPGPRPRSEGYQYGATGVAVGGYQPQPGTYQPALYQKGSPRYSLEGPGGYHQGPVSFPQQGYQLKGYQLPGASAPPPHPGQVHGPVSPIGFNVMDLFNHFNTLTLIPCIDVSGWPMRVTSGTWSTPKLQCGGSYVNVDSEFIPQMVGQGVVSLENGAGRIAVNEKKQVRILKSPYKQGNTAFEFVIRPVRGAVVAFESLLLPGHYLFVDKSGTARLEQQSLECVNVQFTVRVNKFNGPYSQIVLTQFGRPSIMNQLKDRSVIQLYSKKIGEYLSLIEGGKVKGETTERFSCFLVYCDRGMGRVSLKSYQRDLLKLRMTFNGTLTGVGAENINNDFYLKENPDGTVRFESVIMPGKFVYLVSGKGKHKQVHYDFSVCLLDMHRHAGFGVLPQNAYSLKTIL